MAEWIKMPLGMEIGLGPGDFVLDGHPAPPPPKGHGPSPIFGPYLLRTNGCMDQDVTWYGANKSRPRRLLVRLGLRTPSTKGGGAPPQIFGPCLLWPNGWMDEAATWHAGRPRSWPHCVRWEPSSPSPKRGTPPVFGPYLLRPNGCMDQDGPKIGGFCPIFGEGNCVSI